MSITRWVPILGWLYPKGVSSFTFTSSLMIRTSVCVCVCIRVCIYVCVCVYNNGLVKWHRVAFLEFSDEDEARISYGNVWMQIWLKSTSVINNNTPRFHFKERHLLKARKLFQREAICPIFSDEWGWKNLALSGESARWPKGFGGERIRCRTANAWSAPPLWRVRKMSASMEHRVIGRKLWRQ